MRVVLLSAGLLLAGCQGFQGPFYRKAHPERVDDPRLTIDPDIDVTVLSGDYFSGRDPVLEAVLEAG